MFITGGCVDVRLRDESMLVRKNTIMVLTHLILNDMIKIRGQISLMALCMEDEEENIREMARMFFHELSLKVHLQLDYFLTTAVYYPTHYACMQGNTLYNVVPDLISQLSDPECGHNPATFRCIVGYVNT